VFLQQNTTASLLELYFNDSMQTVYACGSGSQQREVDDGADVVFTDTVVIFLALKKLFGQHFIHFDTVQWHFTHVIHQVITNAFHLH